MTLSQACPKSRHIEVTNVPGRIVHGEPPLPHLFWTSGARTLAKAIRYSTSRWSALTRHTTDGRLEMSRSHIALRYPNYIVHCCCSG
jgi:hypothetical protein